MQLDHGDVHAMRNGHGEAAGAVRTEFFAHKTKYGLETFGGLENFLCEQWIQTFAPSGRSRMSNRVIMPTIFSLSKTKAMVVPASCILSMTVGCSRRSPTRGGGDEFHRLSGQA